jgi:hypothetical protein
VEPWCKSPDQPPRSRVSVRPGPPLHSPLPSGMGACLHEPATPSFGTALFVAPQSVNVQPVVQDAHLRGWSSPSRQNRAKCVVDSPHGVGGHRLGSSVPIDGKESGGLTAAQHARLDRMSAGARVVGVDRECPLVRQPNGRLVRIQPSGRLVAATMMASRGLTVKQKRTVIASTKSYTDVWS